MLRRNMAISTSTSPTSVLQMYSTGHNRTVVNPLPDLIPPKPYETVDPIPDLTPHEPDETVDPIPEFDCDI